MLPGPCGLASRSGGSRFLTVVQLGEDRAAGHAHRGRGSAGTPRPWDRLQALLRGSGTQGIGRKRQPQGHSRSPGPTQGEDSEPCLAPAPGTPSRSQPWRSVTSSREQQLHGLPQPLEREVPTGRPSTEQVTLRLCGFKNGVSRSPLPRWPGYGFPTLLGNRRGCGPTGRPVGLCRGQSVQVWDPRHGSPAAVSGSRSSCGPPAADPSLTAGLPVAERGTWSRAPANS